MSDTINFILGQPLTLKKLSPNGGKVQVSRILDVSSHTITVSMPYDSGIMVLWPLGCEIEVSTNHQDKNISFTSEIISRDLGDEKAYTLTLPKTFSQTESSQSQEGMARVIAVTSGKGGVGKTVLTINLAIALAAQGKRVFILDADLGTANVDVLLQLTCKYNIIHLLAGEKNLIDIAVPGPGNITVIPGGSGFQALTQMKDSQFRQIVNSFNQLDGLADIILVDTGAGISRDVSNFLAAADEILVVTTPEPHALTDAYAIIKVMNNLGFQNKIMLTINRTENEQEATLVANKLTKVVSQYLKCNLEYVGFIKDDRAVSQSLKKQYPFLLLEPQSIPSRNVKSIAEKLLDQKSAQPAGIKGFISKLLSFSSLGKKIANPSA